MKKKIQIQSRTELTSNLYINDLKRSRYKVELNPRFENHTFNPPPPLFMNNFILNFTFKKKICELLIQFNKSKGNVIIFQALMLYNKRLHFKVYLLVNLVLCIFSATHLIVFELRCKYVVAEFQTKNRGVQELFSLAIGCFTRPFTCYIVIHQHAEKEG